jgi:hypothetical protein
MELSSNPGEPNSPFDRASTQSPTQAVDEEKEDDEDQDPVAEGETLPPAPPEPSYEKANGIKFFDLCKRLDYLWQLRRDKSSLTKKVADIDKKKALLPPRLLQYLSEPSAEGAPPESIFPLFRLLMPYKDSSRSFLMKESALVKAYIAAFSLQPKTADKLIQ